MAQGWESIAGLLAGTVLLRPYVFAFLLAFLVVAGRDLGWGRATAWLSWGWTVAFVAEYSSTRSGIPFGLYHYTGYTADRELFISNVPLFDPLSFPFLAYTAWCLARVVLGRGRRWASALLGGVLMMLADVVIDPTGEDAVARILAETSGTGVDALLEMSGNPTAIQQGFKALRAGGRASLLGIPTETVTLDLVNDVIFKGATVLGIYGRRMYETWVEMTALLKAKRLNLEPLFGAREGLEQFEKAFQFLQGGLPGKILLYPNGVPR